jgi:hypothetical protein
VKADFTQFVSAQFMLGCMANSVVFPMMCRLSVDTNIMFLDIINESVFIFILLVFFSVGISSAYIVFYHDMVFIRCFNFINVLLFLLIVSGNYVFLFMMIGCNISSHIYVVFIMMSFWIFNFICNLTCSIS